MKTAFIYSDALARYDYGASHPLKPFRLKLTYELIRSCGLLGPDDARVIEPFPASEEDLLAYHRPEYIAVLKAVNGGRTVPGASRFGLGPGDNPVFPGVLDWSRLVAGGSLLAASLVDSGRVDIAFHIGGGLHHAMAGNASGFCYINDAALAIRSLVRKGRRVAYIDIDAHHADGVQEAFSASDQVLTISLHETGAALFPGTGFEYETGIGSGEGFSVNLPLPPGSDDEIFLHALDGVVPDLIDAFRPDIIVSQLGVDSLRGDPLADLNYTTNGFCGAVGRIKAFGYPWVALGGGGYDLGNVARAWTLAWAVMNEAEAPEELPGAFLDRYGAFIPRGRKKLRDEEFRTSGAEKEDHLKQVDSGIDFIRERVLKRVLRDRRLSA